jgi:hypothetical protein
MRYLWVILVTMLLPSVCLGVGAPDYLPDGAHPRIFLTSSVISDLQAKVAANDADWLVLKARADVIVARTVAAYNRTETPEGYIYYSYEGLPWLEAAQVLGIAYKATGTTTYRDKLLELGAAIAAAGNAPIIVDVGFPTRSVAVAAALIYDWCYDSLGTTLKNNLITAMNGWYSMLYNGTDGMYIPLNGNNNYLGGHILGMGLCGIATYGDNATASSILALAKSWWDGPVVTMFANEGQGGAILESYNYGPNHIARIMQYALAIKTATERDIYSSYSSALITNFFYSLKPNRWQSTDEGDMAGSFTGIMGKNLPLLLSTLDGSTQGDKIAYFTDNMATPYGGDASALALQYVGSFDHVLFKNSRTRTDYRTTSPTYYHSLGDNHLFTRSDWTDTAVWASFMGGAAHSVDHQIRVAGHVTMQRGNDYMLVTAGQWKGTDGVTGAPETFTNTNNNQNTLYTNGALNSRYGSNYVGGQGAWGVLNSVLKSQSNSTARYMKSDLTTAYDGNDGTLPGRDLIYWHRNFLHLGGSLFVLYDRVRMKDTVVSKEFRFHLNNQSTNTNVSKLVKSLKGSSALFIKPIYPTTAAVSVAASDNAVGSPVAKVTDSATSTDFNPLTVLVLGANDLADPSITGIDTTSMLGVETGGKVAMFSKDGTERTTVSYTTGATADHLLVDMSPGVYTVTKNGSAVGDYTASSQGVLSFSTTGGGAIVATKTGTAPDECDGSHLNLCTTIETCSTTGNPGYWYNNTCNASAQGGGGITNASVTHKAGNTYVTRKAGNTAVTIQ